MVQAATEHAADRKASRGSKTVLKFVSSRTTMGTRLREKREGEGRSSSGGCNHGCMDCDGCCLLSSARVVCCCSCSWRTRALTIDAIRLSGDRLGSMGLGGLLAPKGEAGEEMASGKNELDGAAAAGAAAEAEAGTSSGPASAAGASSIRGAWSGWEWADRAGELAAEEA